MLMRHDLTLGASSEWKGEAGIWSCTYLRPVGAQELSMQVLCVIVEQLTECRCGACVAYLL